MTIPACIEAWRTVYHWRLTSIMTSLLTVITLASVTVRPAAGQTSADTTRKVIELPTVYLGPGGVVLPLRSMVTTGSSTTVLDSATAVAPGSRTLSELLIARLPGVSVLRSSGVLGAGSRVRLRGASSFISRREPLLVIDGTRVDGNQTSATLNMDGLVPSRLDDIDVDDVERIEVLRGPAAAAMYGADAAGGVIRITTHTPNAAPRLRFHIEGGATVDATDYPTNFSTGTGRPGDPTCARFQQALGTCTPGPLLSWNPLEQASPFQVGTRVRAGGNATGALTRRASYLVSGAVHDESGVLAPNHARRYTGRINVDAKPGSRFDVSLRSAYMDAETSFPFSQTVLLAGLAGNAVDDPVNRGYAVGATDRLERLRRLRTDQDVRRFIGSISGSWRPASWVSITTLAGYESLRRNEDQASPLIFQFEPSPTNMVRFAAATERSDRTNLSGTATLNYPVITGVTGETTVGIEWLNRSFRNAQLAGTTGGGFGSQASTLRTRINGLSATERLVWQRRRSIGLGVRRDRFTSVGFLPATNVMLDAAWGLSDEPFFPGIRGLNTLRLRSAYGRATDTRPLLGAVLVSIPPFPGAPQNVERDGERISEVEVGLDANLFGRISLDATWYRQHSKDALAQSGFGTGVLATAGAWRMTGIDAELSARLVNTLHTEWNARLTASTLSSRVERYRSDFPSSRDQPVPGARPFIRAGYPIAGIWGNRIQPRDANGDGILTPNEIDVSSESVFLGSPIPTREIGLSSSLARRRIRVEALIDYRGGFRQFDLTRAVQCEVAVCGTLYAPKASASEQARVVSLPRGYSGFVEDGSFVRLREVAVTWTILPGWSWRHGFQKLTLTASGRNLLTFTGYSGLDPEVNASGQSSFGSMEFATLPLPRTFLMRLDIAR